MIKSWDSPVRYLKGIGPKKAKIFHKLGVNTIEDLVYYFPRRYEDRTMFIPISELQEGQVHTVKAKVLSVEERRSFRRRGFSIIELAVTDTTGKISCVWFNQPYLKEYFKIGQQLILYGKIERYGTRLQMASPEFEIATIEQEGSVNIGRIVPIYPLPEGITQRYLRQLIKYALERCLGEVNDFLPYDIRMRNNLLNLAKGLINIHFPDNFDIQKQAYERLSFEEFFLFQLLLALRKSRRKEKAGIAHIIKGRLPNDFIANLPFRLTKSQEKVIEEIEYDMSRPVAMQRLLQGDVGSGKTVVATIASLIAIQGRYQVAFMAPTEILARQHYLVVSRQVLSLRAAPRIVLLTGSLDQKSKALISKDIARGNADLVIGTHALLEGGIEFSRLGLVVIDEQHKFGVGQRALLPKKGPNPDTLIMTATPIPRTLAITIYADLDCSVIKELPPGRLPVKTMHFREDAQDKAFDIARGQLRQGHQAYIIYPVIEESYALDIAGAKKRYEELRISQFKEFRLGLIHGRLRQKEQDEIMLRFQGKEIDVLISTTVLEVGIDVPEATCMIIEHAHRFGLAQLHQLRGRVGRGASESFCILISNAESREARARLKAMLEYADGFRIAEEDLKIRGPGEFFGRRQHGLTELRIANPLTQMQLLRKARDEAIRTVNSDRHLRQRANLLLREKLLQRFPEYNSLVMVG